MIAEDFIRWVLDNPHASPEAIIAERDKLPPDEQERLRRLMVYENARRDLMQFGVKLD